MSVRDRVLGVIRRIVGTQMIVDILRDQRRADDWAPHITSSVLVAELQRRLASRAGAGSSALDVELRGHLLSIIGARLGTSPAHDVHVAAKQAFDTLIAGAHPDALAVAEVVALDFREALRDPGLPLDVACRYYDILYGLYWCGAQRFTDMARFDTKAVIPFAEWLRSRYMPRSTPRDLPCYEQPLRVGYLSTYGYLAKENAIAKIYTPIILQHAQHLDRKVFLYCVGYSTQEYLRQFEGTQVTVRDFPQESRYDSIDTISNNIQTDNLDILITDVGSAVASVLFVQRVAPIQMWIDHGYPFWSIDELDWVMLPQKDFESYFGISQYRHSPITFRSDHRQLLEQVDDQAVQEARSFFPENAFILAFFGRKVKISKEYINAVREILIKIPRAYFLAAGTGRSSELEKLSNDPYVSNRVAILPHAIDIRVYGNIVDIFLDTFPFYGGVAVREMQTFGVPVVSLMVGQWDRILREDRVQELVSSNINEYIDITCKLCTDNEFYSRAKAKTYELSKTYLNYHTLIDEVELAIKTAINHKTKNRSII